MAIAFGQPGAVCVDLGCGRIKLPGFIGVDRFPMPGVDVVVDLDGRLPFADDSVDLIYASHSLEHIRNLLPLMREVSRVCKHGAQLCVVAPYHHQGLNLANPYHVQAFNEHTPRFWTASPVTTVDPAEYYHPHAGAWGLLESDNTTPDIDIRCVKMEFFYFPEYRRLPADEQRRCRKQRQDVCDQVVFHLLVLKQPVSDEEYLQMARDMEPFESPYIALRRLQEHCERLEKDNEEASAYVRKLEDHFQEVTRYKDKVEHDYHELYQYKDRLEADLQAVSQRKQQVEALYQEAVRQKDVVQAERQTALHEADGHDAETLRSKLARLQHEVAVLEQERVTLQRLEAVLAAHGQADGPGGPPTLLLRFRRAASKLAPPHSLHGRFVRFMGSIPRRLLRAG